MRKMGKKKKKEKMGAGPSKAKRSIFSKEKKWFEKIKKNGKNGQLKKHKITPPKKQALKKNVTRLATFEIFTQKKKNGKHNFYCPFFAPKKRIKKKWAVTHFFRKFFGCPSSLYP